MNELVTKLNRAVSGQDLFEVAVWLSEQMEQFKPREAADRGEDYESIALGYIFKNIDCLKLGWIRDTGPNMGVKIKLSQLHKALPHRYKIEGRMIYWHEWLEQHYPLWINITSGNIYNGLTEVRPLISELTILNSLVGLDEQNKVIHRSTTLRSEGDQEPLLNDEEEQDQDQAYTEEADLELDDVVGELSDFVTIDVRALQNYILDQRELVKYSKFVDTKARKLREIGYADSLLNENTKGILEMQYTIKASGRKYYKGVNLQACPSKVRVAALGKCYEYDLNCAMWRWKLLKTVSLGRKQGWTEQDLMLATRGFREMVSNKNQTRQRIMSEVFTDEKGLLTQEKTKLDRVKQALSALGFGCSHSTHPKGALSEAFRGGHLSEGRVSRFLSNLQVQELIMGNQVLQHLLENEYSVASGKLDRDRIELLLKKELVGGIPKNSLKPRKLSDSAVLRKLEAHLYQEWESQVMKLIQSHCPGKILLHVHDCVYTDLPLRDIADLTYHVITKWEMEDLTNASIHLWRGCGRLFGEDKGTVGKHHNRYVGKVANQTSDAEWKAKITAEETKALNYRSVNVEQDNKRSITPSEHQMDARAEVRALSDYIRNKAKRNTY